MTLAMNLTLGAAGIGLVGGIVAERMVSPGSIDRARDGDRWNALHEDFLDEHPAPAGTSVFVSSQAAWRNAALAGGAGLGAAALGGGLMLASRRIPQLGMPMFVAGLGLAALGGAAALGTSASWAVR